jgi:hypothetical protein
MTDSNLPHLNRRDLLRAGSALIVAFAGGASQAQQRNTPQLKAGKMLKTDEVDGFIALAPDGTATIYCGKVDLGTGLRIAALACTGLSLPRLSLSALSCPAFACGGALTLAALSAGLLVLSVLAAGFVAFGTAAGLFTFTGAAFGLALLFRLLGSVGFRSFVAVLTPFGVLRRGHIQQIILEGRGGHALRIKDRATA